MDSFNEELLLPREWLIKVDAQTSTPYLLKFHSSPVDLTCCIMITDTKQTWVEVLSSKQFARRWRECNKRVDSPPLVDDEQEAWRTRSLDLLSRVHTLSGILELSFEVTESKYADCGFQLECDAFKWRWETIFVGHKISAEILSKHLIMPLISTSHFAFSSPDVVGDLPVTDLEKAVDKMARAARRTVDTHVKNALSKPRLATTIRRITAVFNFISDPPSVATDADPVLLAPPEPPELLAGVRARTPEPDDHPDASTGLKRDTIIPVRKRHSINRAVDSESATESEDDPLVLPPRSAPGSGIARTDQQPDIRMRSPTPSREVSPRLGGARSRNLSKAPSDTDSSPVRPIKKSKPRVPSSDEDSEEERKKFAAQIRRGAAPTQGLRQPVKRGGKRF